LGRITFGSKGGRVRVSTAPSRTAPPRPIEDVVREMKAARQTAEDTYRERSLALHGLVCARCGRAFEAVNRHLLTVHHRDGDHHNNPPDGSNWENLCVYCHEDTHSRGLLGDFLEGASPAAPREEAVVYRGETAGGEKGLGSLGDRLKKALEAKKTTPR
jgi:hypothetical protein